MTRMVCPGHFVLTMNCKADKSGSYRIILLSKKTFEYRNQIALAPMSDQKIVQIGSPLLFAVSRLVGGACFGKPLACRVVVFGFASVHDVLCLVPTGLDDPVEVRLRCEGDIDYLLYQGVGCVRLQGCYSFVEQSLV